MSKFIPRIIPNFNDASTGLPVGSLVWYFGRLNDVAAMPDWIVANGGSANLALYPGLANKFNEVYDGDMYCGITATFEYYTTSKSTTTSSNRNTSKQYISTSSNASSFYEVISTPAQNGPFSWEAAATTIVSNWSNTVTDVLVTKNPAIIFSKTESTAYLWTYSNNAWSYVTIKYQTNANYNDTKRWARIIGQSVHKRMIHSASSRAAADSLMTAWATLKSKSTNEKKKISNHITIGELPPFEENVSSSETELFAYIYDINSKLIAYYTDLKNQGMTSGLSSFSVQFPDLTEGSAMVASTNASKIGTSTSGEVPNISGSFYGCNSSDGGTNASGAFSPGTTKIFGASGHNGVTIWACRMSFSASASSSVYKSTAKSVLPAGVYAIPIIKIK